MKILHKLLHNLGDRLLHSHVYGDWEPAQLRFPMWSAPYTLILGAQDRSCYCGWLERKLVGPGRKEGSWL